MRHILSFTLALSSPHHMAASSGLSEGRMRFSPSQAVRHPAAARSERRLYTFSFDDARISSTMSSISGAVFSSR